jgi:hypothetical protein
MFELMALFIGPEEKDFTLRGAGAFPPKVASILLLFIARFISR